MIFIDNINAQQENRQKISNDIYLLAKRLAEFIGNIDEERNGVDDK